MFGRKIAGFFLIVFAAVVAGFTPIAARWVQTDSVHGLPVGQPAFDFAMTDSTGQLRKLSSLRTNIVLYFGYSRCTSVCRPALARLKRLLADPDLDITVVFISLDPGHDSPEVLKRLTQDYGPRFLALTSTFENLERTARAYRLTYSYRCRDGNCDIFHSDMACLIDARGTLQFLYPGTDERQIRHDILSLQEGNTK